jgi:hypothetical protein
MSNKQKKSSQIYSTQHIAMLRTKKCGLINCRSRLEKRNPIRDEIKETIMCKFGLNRENE